ncbi:hypothetical protein [Flavivirga jejuensis]|uniref:YD repeat-containing protein n=1 Tax=Flavivirga jejuensis TaxID=870487 RepID=A0ABT8WRD5_9FLAO|nr:hypothetical protein [Flavivirga jejuensis]MDO5975724.1 hypothetical protein [Flavivirga jejuensis]
MKKLTLYFTLLLTFNSFAQIEIKKRIYEINGSNKQYSTEIFTFDKKGRLIIKNDFYFYGTRITTYEYNKRGYIVSKKRYKTQQNYEKKQILFRWDYAYNDKSQIESINGSLSKCNYFYDENNRLYKYERIMHRDSSKTIYRLKYNSKNELIEKSYEGNWKKIFTKRNDTLITHDYLFDFPKNNDTTKTILKEVFKNSKIVYRYEFDFPKTTIENYNYAKNGQLVSEITTRLNNKKENQYKSKYTYFNKSGIIKGVNEFALFEDMRVLEYKIKFEIINGSNINILSKKVKNKINQELTGVNRATNDFFY